MSVSLVKKKDKCGVSSIQGVYTSKRDLKEGKRKRANSKCVSWSIYSKR